MRDKTSSVVTLVFDKSQSFILLVKRCDVPVWVLPGGGVEDNESSQSAAAREVYEESGIKATSLQLAAEFFPINALSRHTQLFKGIAEDGPLLKTDESLDAAFFRFEDFPVNTFHIHKGWIKEALDNQQVVKRALDEVSYKEVLKFLVKNPLIFFRYFLSWIGLPINTGNPKNDI